MSSFSRALGGLMLVMAAASASGAAPPADSTQASTAPVVSGGLATLPAGPATGDEAAVGLTANWSVCYASHYVWQGFDYSDRRPVVQPQVVLGLKGATATFWFDYSQTNRLFDEGDAILRYGGDWTRCAAGVSYARYTYPNRVGWSPSQEFITDFSWKGLFSPAAELHYDFDAGRGAYAILSGSQPLGILPLSLGSRFFYQEKYFGMRGIPAVALDANASRSLGPIALTGTLSRYLTWDNGTFRRESSVPSSWVFSLNLGLDH